MELNVIDHKSQLHVSRTVYSWTIENFSSCITKPGEYIESQKFDVPGKNLNKGCIRLYPCGTYAVNKEDAIFFLAFDIQCTIKEIRCQINIYDSSCKRLKDIKKHDQKDDYMLSYIKRDALASILSAKNDILVVKFHFDWPEETPVETKEFNKLNSLHQISSDFNKLLKKGDLSDIILVTRDGSEFPVHKCVLAARSAVFAVMFELNMMEKQESKIEIGVFDGKTLNVVLHYIYTGEFLKDECEIYQALTAAGLYGLKGLKWLIEREICGTITIENVIIYLQLSDMYHSNLLKSESLAFISKNLKEVIKTDTFEELKISHPDLLEEILNAIANE